MGERASERIGGVVRTRTGLGPRSMVEGRPARAGAGAAAAAALLSRRTGARAQRTRADSGRFVMVTETLGQIFLVPFSLASSTFWGQMIRGQRKRQKGERGKEGKRERGDGGRKEGKKGRSKGRGTSERARDPAEKASERASRGRSRK